MGVEFKWNLGAFENAGDKKLNTAITRALYVAGTQAVRVMKTGASRRIRDRKRFKVSAVKAGMDLTSPKSRTQISSLVWKLQISGRPVPLIEFPHRQLRKGVKIQVNQGKWTLVPHSFLATMRSGHEGVFQRLGKARLPIREAYSTRLTDVFKDDGMIPALMKTTREEFAKTYARILPGELAKLKR